MPVDSTPTFTPPTARPWRPSPLIYSSVGLHAASLATLALMSSGWPWVLSALAANHLVLSIAGMWPRGQWLGPSISRLPETSVAAGEIGLSFDDGPDPEVTPRVLEILARRGVRASFFLIGQRAAAHPELVEQILSQGHLLENHTYHHPNHFAFFGPRAQAREIDRTQDLLEKLSGRKPGWFRAPAGIRNPFTEPILARRGLHLASWTRRGFDTVERRPELVVKRLLRGLAPGHITLLHDGSVARDHDGQPVVLEALTRLLDFLDEQGWKAVPLPSRLS